MTYVKLLEDSFAGPAQGFPRSVLRKIPHESGLIIHVEGQAGPGCRDPRLGILRGCLLERRPDEVGTLVKLHEADAAREMVMNPIVTSPLRPEVVNQW